MIIPNTLCSIRDPYDHRQTGGLETAQTIEVGYIYIYYIQLFVSNSNPISISSIKLVDIPIHFHWLVIYIIPLKLGVLSPIVTTSPFCCLINEHESHFSW